MARWRDTIYSLSSAPGRAGIAVIRVSGDQASEAIRRMCKKPLKPRVYVNIRGRSCDSASRTRLVHAASREFLDDSIVVEFPKPNR